jgi:membrane-bound inhibitor of C-type lysozyme
MGNRFTCWTSTALACLGLLMTGCGSVNLWPFGSDTAPERSRAPANATEYQCDAGKRFYVRYLDGGAAWVILPEREIRLDKVAAASGTRYSNGSATLEVNGNEAALTDAPAISFTGCKRAGG